MLFAGCQFFHLAYIIDHRRHQLPVASVPYGKEPAHETTCRKGTDSDKPCPDEDDPAEYHASHEGKLFVRFARTGCNKRSECDARHGHQQCDRRNLHRRQPQVIRKVVDQIRSEDRVGNEIDQAGADDVPDRFQLQDLKIFSEHILDVLCSQDLLLIGILYKARHIGLFDGQCADQKRRPAGNPYGHAHCRPGLFQRPANAHEEGDQYRRQHHAETFSDLIEHIDVGPQHRPLVIIACQLRPPGHIRDKEDGEAPPEENRHQPVIYDFESIAHVYGGKEQTGDNDRRYRRHQ